VEKKKQLPKKRRTPGALRVKESEVHKACEFGVYDVAKRGGDGVLGAKRHLHNKVSCSGTWESKDVGMRRKILCAESKT